MPTMLNDADLDGISKYQRKEQREIVVGHKNIFRTSFLAGPPAKVKPIEIYLVPKATKVRVQLLNYSHAHHAFLSNFVSLLVTTNMAHSNFPSALVRAPLLVPNRLP